MAFAAGGMDGSVAAKVLGLGAFLTFIGMVVCGAAALAARLRVVGVAAAAKSPGRSAGWLGTTPCATLGGPPPRRSR